MNSTESQLKRKRSTDSESEDSIIVKKRLKHRKLFVPAKFSSEVKYCKANNRYYLDSIFTPEQIYRIFPHLKISVQKGNPNILVQQHLAYVKATGTEEEKIKFCVHPPKGVSEIDWVCFLGPFCPFFFVGAGALNAEELKSCISPKKLTYQDLNNFFLPYLFEKSTTRNSNILKQVDFLCLLPIEDSDLNRLKEFLGDSVQKERFFACPCHFKSWVKTGSEVRANKAEGLQLVFDRSLQAELKVKNLPIKKKKVLIDFHRRIANSVTNPNPNRFSSSTEFGLTIESQLEAMEYRSQLASPLR
jgi:hypothetical protein